MLYEDLYGESSLMQQHLFMSYKNVFRFWSRVDKECDRCSEFTNVPQRGVSGLRTRPQRLVKGSRFI